MPKMYSAAIYVVAVLVMDGYVSQVIDSSTSQSSSHDCPWPEDMTDLVLHCTCTTGTSGGLEVKCDGADIGRVLGALRGSSQQQQRLPLHTLAIANTSVPVLTHNMFSGLTVSTLSVTNCRVRHVQHGAFAGLAHHLLSLDLSNNRLSAVPVRALAPLRVLQSLDLSYNQIERLDDGTFAQGTAAKTLQTLRLSGNNITVTDQALTGLETSLRTLILKNMRLEQVPAAVRRMKNLRFLDLSQNYFTRLPASAFSGLDSVSALNLERNLIQVVDDGAFDDVNDTLSSLSLLNNLIAEMPTKALSSASRLRVLDLGFNLISKLEEDSFTAHKSLALLAIDGNLISSIPEATFRPLSNSLMGLSIGGKFLECDCRMRWILEWIRDKKLQITSREVNPQFCGAPNQLRDKTFYQIQPDEMVCQNKTYATSDETTESRIEYNHIGEIGVPSEEIEIKSADIIAGRPSFVSSGRERIVPTSGSTVNDATTQSSVSSTTSAKPTNAVRTIYGQPTVDIQPLPPTSSTPTYPRPNLIFREQQTGGERTISTGIASPVAKQEEVKVQSAYRIDNSLVIQWDSDVQNILGFRVIYRLFGDKAFKQGPPLASSEKEFKIKNVPSQECIIVCVVSLEEIDLTPETVPQRQCREVRTDPDPNANMDTFVIGASAAICATIVIAVFVFVCCNRRRSQKSQELPTILSATPGPPLASMGALRGEKEWDQLSMYSQRSIPRARMYHMDKGAIGGGLTDEDVRSQLARASSRRRSMMDPQPARSYSALSVAHLPALASSRHSLALSRPDMRTSRTSLAPAGLDGAMMTSSVLGRHHYRCHDSTDNEDVGDLMHLHPPHHHHHHHHHQGAQLLSNERRRRASRRLSRAGSRAQHYDDDDGERRVEDNGAGEDDETDGWTDHDMDIYMTTNATTGHNNLVQL